MMRPMLLLSILLAAAAGEARAQEQSMKVDVIAVESLDDFQSWLKKSMAAARQGTAMPAPYPPSVRSIAANRKLHFPILVGNLRPPAQGVVDLVADLELLGPDGKSISVQKRCCSFRIENRPDYRTVMLSPTINVEMDRGDTNGTYTVRVSVSDGTRRAEAATGFEFAQGSGMPQGAPGATAPPRLRMAPPPRNPGGDLDKRDCLSLPTPSEVIRCAEGK